LRMPERSARPRNDRRPAGAARRSLGPKPSNLPRWQSNMRFKAVSSSLEEREGATGRQGNPGRSQQSGDKSSPFLAARLGQG
jgi:hypothetical protein